VSYIPLESSRLESIRVEAKISKHRGLYVCITYVLRTNIPHFQHFLLEIEASYEAIQTFYWLYIHALLLTDVMLG